MILSFSAQVKCFTPWAVRGICDGYFKANKVAKKATLHYEFKDVGDYGLLRTFTLMLHGVFMTA